MAEGIKIYANPMKVKNANNEYVPIANMIFGGEIGDVIKQEFNKQLGEDGALSSIINQALSSSKPLLNELQSEWVQFEIGGINGNGALQNLSNRIRNKNFISNVGTIYMPDNYQFITIAYYIELDADYEQTTGDVIITHDDHEYREIKRLRKSQGQLTQQMRSYTFQSSITDGHGQTYNEDIKVLLSIGRNDGATISEGEPNQFAYEYMYFNRLMKCLNYQYPLQLRLSIAPLYVEGQAYNVNSIFWKDNKLLKVTTNIAATDSLSDSNTTETSIAELIAQLRAALSTNS